ncbi:MAG: 2-amino-4-hydroxy-6-hydroxymethyldihydropteridine diphosphokinase [Flavobacteriia bacterium]|nr:2-amino-4-hydroxy-6-hydroxymethyldihydropteridine diphosphokinase [Flavobacteriia bacterium]
MKKKDFQIVLSIGSNLGNPKENILKSYDFIEIKIGKIIKKSSFYSSKSWGFDSENEFVNSCIIINSEHPPHQLIKLIKCIEKEMGRVYSNSSTYEDRIIDIDILFVDDLILKTNELQIPHPLIYQRDFVLIPLKEICSDFIDPQTKKKLNEFYIKLKNFFANFSKKSIFVLLYSDET